MAEETKNKRLKQLLQYEQDDPQDPFNLYAIALEYLNLDPAMSQDYFERLLQDHPDYLPTYYHAAEYFFQLGDPNKTREIYEQGIALAAKQQDLKAKRELSNAYGNFLLELDEDE